MCDPRCAPPLVLFAGLLHISNSLRTWTGRSFFCYPITYTHLPNFNFLARLVSEIPVYLYIIRRSIILSCGLFAPCSWASCSVRSCWRRGLRWTNCHERSSVTVTKQMMFSVKKKTNAFDDRHKSGLSLDCVTVWRYIRASDTGAASKGIVTLMHLSSSFLWCGRKHLLQI